MRNSNKNKTYFDSFDEYFRGNRAGLHVVAQPFLQDRAQHATRHTNKKAGNEAGRGVVGIRFARADSMR